MLRESRTNQRAFPVLLLLATLGGATAAGATGCVGTVGDVDGDVDPPGTPSGNDAGRVTLHRLNRVEYDNTVRDLLGVTGSPAADFPTDDHAFGFDNMADTLTLSPLQFELYDRTAENLSEEVLGLAIASQIARFEAEVIGGSVGQASGGAWNLYSNGDVSLTQALPEDGQYIVRARVWQDAAGPDAAQASISVGGQTFGPFDVTGSEATPQLLEQTVDAQNGPALIMVSFLNDFTDPVAGTDRNLYVDWIEIEGPVGATGANPLRDKLVTCDPALDGEPCVRELLGTIGKRAYRRPLTAAELDGLVGIYGLALAQGDDENEGLKLALRAILLSSHFLFRVELDTDPTSETAHLLDDYELASRLSYFLWSSMPDDALLALADKGTLSDPKVLAAQVDRMLDDPKAVALVENFAGQWLYTRALADRTPNAGTFPDFDENLREAMRQEANLVFAEFLKSDALTLDQLVRADFTFANDRLAQHYGLTGVTGSEMTKIALDGSQRGGLLKEGAWLTVTSNPDRTSPVKRGKWILENLLCQAPAPPPPGVEGFKPADLEAKTQKELLAAHRANPACAGCHNAMDPLGLALENYDGIGAWRTTDKGQTIDPAGEVDGTAFATSTDFAELLAGDPRLTACAAQKVFTYALGRGPTDADAPYLETIDDSLKADGASLRRLIHLVVESEPFRYRHGEKEAL